QKFLYILTDCTRSAWETGQSDALKNTGKDLAGLFGPRIRLYDLGKTGQWNYAVLDLKPDGSLVTTNFHTDFLADVKGFGQGSDALLQWKWDDQALPGGEKLRLDALTDLQRQTKANVKEGGAHVLTASIIGDDRLPLDDSRNRVIAVASELKVLIVEGERGTGLLSGAGAFLDLALAPVKEVGPNGRVRSDSYV